MNPATVPVIGSSEQQTQPLSFEESLSDRSIELVGWPATDDRRIPARRLQRYRWPVACALKIGLGQVAPALAFGAGADELLHEYCRLQLA